MGGLGDTKIVLHLQSYGWIEGFMMGGWIDPTTMARCVVDKVK